MPSSPLLCVDASIVVRLVTVASNNPVRDTWLQWRREGRQFVAPRLLRYEVANALHRARRAGFLDQVTAPAAMKTALSQPIDFYDEESIHEAAIETAWKLNRPATYDAHYLALAQKLGAEFWTLDQRLFNAVRHQLAWVHLVGSSE